VEDNKTHKILLLIAILVVAIYSVGMDVINSNQLKRNNEKVDDVRMLLFASLNDVDTLFLEDRIMIFKRGYDSRKMMMERIKEGGGMNIIWNPEKTINEIDIYDERNQIPDFNIDTEMIDGESTNDTINNLSEKTE
jgi:hypothetical protein